MMMKNLKLLHVLYRKGICLLLVMVLLGSICMPVLGAEQSERETIRVGFFAQDGYHMIDEDGNKCGYGYDFLRMAAKYLDVEYEYIGYERSWDDMEKMLLNGQIDMVTSARMTPERMEQFDFSKPIATASVIVTVKMTTATLLPRIMKHTRGCVLVLWREQRQRNRLRNLPGIRAFPISFLFMRVQSMPQTLCNLGR